MSSRGQPTPPFNSPYQHAMKPTTLLHSPAYPSPAYPSPARSDSEPSRYQNEGLGLYNFPPHFNASAQPSHILFPPSPHSTEHWRNMPNGASPLMPDPIVDPWTSGAYDHPVSRSPLPWSQQYHDSPRSSLSSHRHTSVFSTDESEAGYPNVKLENASGWGTDDDATLPGTVAPERLLKGHAVFTPYDHSYGSPMMPNTPGLSHYMEAQVESSHSTQLTQKACKRRSKSDSQSRFTCEVCGKGFVRSYNKKTHMERHKPNREKMYKCGHPECTRKFDRKTDLDRHIKSVHDKIRDKSCPQCGDSFSRKDTLTRHASDGCQKKNQVSPSQIPQARSMCGAANTLYPSPQPDQYAPANYWYGRGHV